MRRDMVSLLRRRRKRRKGRRGWREKRLQHQGEKPPVDKLSRAVTVKQELQNLIDAVRSKYRELRRTAEEMELGARPFVAPLQKAMVESIKGHLPPPQPQPMIVKKEEAERSVVAKDKNLDTSSTTTTTTTTTTPTTSPAKSLPETYLARLANPIYKDKLDFTYGVRPDGSGGTLIGDSKIQFSKTKVYVNETAYKVTHGLLELLFMKVPNRTLFGPTDLTIYKEILISTNAHLQMYSPEKPINANRGKKYTSVISEMFVTKPPQPPPRAEGSLFEGSGIQFTSYNNNVNTLVNRMRLLVMSRAAGHTGHDNEISQIIAALRQNRIIT